MARKSPTYALVELEAIAAPAPAASEEATVEAPAASAARRGRPPAAKTLKEAAAPVMLYLHPAGAKALKRYALDQNTKVHTLLLEAVEVWARGKGLREPMRVQDRKANRG